MASKANLAVGIESEIIGGTPLSNHDKAPPTLSKQTIASVYSGSNFSLTSAISCA
jgi:hypothetical protein